MQGNLDAAAERLDNWEGTGPAYIGCGLGRGAGLGQGFGRGTGRSRGGFGIGRGAGMTAGNPRSFAALPKGGDRPGSAENNERSKPSSLVVFGGGFVLKGDVVMRTLAVGMVCLALVLLAVSPAVLAGEGEQYTYTFRSTWWGMSQDEVRQAENSSFIREETKQRQLIYECTIDGYECNIFYGFDNRKKLISGAYAIDSQKVKHANLNDYLDDYDYFRDLLVAKYGRPWMEGPKWNELVYRDYAGTYGLAVSTGKLYYLANWATTCSDITLNLQGSDGRIVLTIVYTTTGTMPPLLEPGQTQEAANL